MILKAAHSFGNLRLDNDAGVGDKSSASRLDEKTYETKIIDHRKRVRSQKQTKTAEPLKIAPKKCIIRRTTKLRLWAEQSRLDKTAQAADARKRTVNLPHQSGDA